MKHILQTLILRKDLTPTQVCFAAENLLRGLSTPVETAAFLSLLAAKGESVDEIAGFISSAKKYMKTMTYSAAIDVCGTGGDGKHTFNISTAVAIVSAAAGAYVAKHGNRAVSGTSGSADVLEALGVHIMLTPSQAESVLKKTGIVFLFAPLFHPLFKNIAPVRKELGIPTIFNLLGPFLNPALVKRQLIGVSNISIAEKLLHVAEKINYKHLLIVVGEGGMDEVSLSGKTQVFELNNGKHLQYLFDPKQYGFKKTSPSYFSVKSSKESADIITKILNNKKDAKRDIVIINSAYALYVSGKVKSIRDGMLLADEVIASGKAKKVLENLIKETQVYA